jgi:hypothetical protein
MGVSLVLGGYLSKACATDRRAERRKGAC